MTPLQCKGCVHLSIVSMLVKIDKNVHISFYLCDRNKRKNGKPTKIQRIRDCSHYKKSYLYAVKQETT